ncbi:MAG: RnfABCDGE type electron transport complex subunit D [Gemmatimonadetes bacterium]|nr:RnfABCDGE type electron transport complex subunit D [Gemmatimonadota bacterium]
MTAPNLIVAASPHLKDRDTTPRIMWTVAASLIPVILSSAFFFGISAILVILASTLGALLTERWLGRPGALRDGSAMITGLLLGLSLPPGMPLWMAVLGGFFGIAFGKAIWGGLGQNGFNPALIGRAFLQTAFPVAITTWPKPGGDFLTLKGDLFAFPFTSPAHDVLTSATPLGLFKFEQKLTPIVDLVLGTTGGSVGETSAVIILLCGAFLAWKGYLNWRSPVSIIVAVFVLGQILHWVNPARAADGMFHIFSGGLMLGAVYMATDMVTVPTTNQGRWIFGACTGALVVVIRVYGGLPEGVMYAILIMNAFTPLINRVTHPRVFGTVKMKEAKS